MTLLLESVGNRNASWWGYVLSAEICFNFVDFSVSTWCLVTSSSKSKTKPNLGWRGSTISSVISTKYHWEQRCVTSRGRSLCANNHGCIEIRVAAPPSSAICGYITPPLSHPGHTGTLTQVSPVLTSLYIDNHIQCSEKESTKAFSLL